ncbi:MAG: hypothetical protein IKP81_00945 [Paludibacteraceae bacterium]|nr:hypothetical protein [Paludibacteraceae bacterium]MBR6103608.1 hypothetical protein [Paludibacteraceae bacterium]
MENVDMKYSFCSMEEPTDEQLKQIMREACEDAKQRGKEAKEKYFRELKQAIQEVIKEYEEKNGTT